MNDRLTSWVEALRELLFPTCRCPFCDQPETLAAGEICPACRQMIADSALGWQPCRLCAAFIPAGQTSCGGCHGRPEGNWLDQSWAAAPYEGVIKASIRRFKYHRGVWLEKPLARLMLDTLPRLDHAAWDMVVPVPLHPDRLQARGYNQVELLGRVIAKGLGLPLQSRVLVRRLNTPSQTSLGRQERLVNLQNAFAVVNRDKIARKRILLVDDIFTTGATGNACARVLKEGGCAAVFLITCAAGKQQNIAP